VAVVLGTPAPENPAVPPDAGEVLGSEETPLHPQIIGHFKLEWATPGMRWRYRSAFLNLDEYLRAYAAFTPIPVGNPPQLWLARAQQAFALNNFPEAHRLLLAATAQFPEHPHFLQYLGALFMRQSNFLEAEKVIRYAISLHPHVPQLYCELGVVMVRRNFPDEAVRMFNETLRLDANHKDARQHLGSLLARSDALKRRIPAAVWRVGTEQRLRA
jgi:tetratricopeptide (TPR) repeat protein